MERAAASFALKHRRHHRPLRSRADHVGGRLFAQQQSQRVNQNGLARSGLASQKIQTSRELDHDIVDDGVIFQSKFGQHKDPVRVARAPSPAAFDFSKAK